MLSYKRAIEVISDYISDMTWKERRQEIEWMLKQSYPEKDIKILIEDWDLEDRETWKIKEYVDEKDIHKTHSSD